MDSVDHHFHPLYVTICDIFKDIPVPNNRLQLFQDIETTEQITSDEENKINVQNELQIDSSEPSKFTISTDVYLYRSSRKERIFVPPKSKEDSTKEPKNTEQNDFISVTNYDSDEFDTNIKKNTRYINICEKKHSKNRKDLTKINNTSSNIKYLPLKVKRLQGNINRIKSTKVNKKRQ